MTANNIYLIQSDSIMWTAKFQIKHDDCWISSKTAKFDVIVKGIPLNSYEEKGKEYHINIIFLSGPKEQQDKLFNELKKDKRVKKIIRKKHQIISLVEGKEFVAIDFDKSFFFLKPVEMKNGYECWEIGAWDKRKLNNFYKTISKYVEVKILKMTKGFPQVFIQHATMNLTNKQKDAFELAKERGYYEFPRKISVKDLSKQMKVPRTTFQGHLRKAEKKLLDVVLE